MVWRLWNPITLLFQITTAISVFTHPKVTHLAYEFLIHPKGGGPPFSIQTFRLRYFLLKLVPFIFWTIALWVILSGKATVRALPCNWPTHSENGWFEVIIVLAISHRAANRENRCSAPWLPKWCTLTHQGFTDHLSSSAWLYGRISHPVLIHGVH